jgi:uncharacterized protein YcfJ
MRGSIMNRSMLVGTFVGVTLAAAGAVVAGYALRSEDTDTQPAAQVASDTAAAPAPAHSAPPENCWNETVTHQADPKDDKRIAGTAIGAVVGGVIGSTIGGGDGKKVATVAGAAGGAYAGNRAQKEMQERNTYTTVERHCEPAQ